MSIGRRLIDLARSELNSLLDRAARTEDGDERDPDEDLYRPYGLDQLSDQEIEAELERRRRSREAAARAARGPAPGARPSPSSQTGARPAEGTGQRPRPAARPASSADELRRAYAALEVPYG